MNKPETPVIPKIKDKVDATEIAGTRDFVPTCVAALKRSISNLIQKYEEKNLFEFNLNIDFDYDTKIVKKIAFLAMKTYPKYTYSVITHENILELHIRKR